MLMSPRRSYKENQRWPLQMIWRKWKQRGSLCLLLLVVALVSLFSRQEQFLHSASSHDSKKNEPGTTSPVAGDANRIMVEARPQTLAQEERNASRLCVENPFVAKEDPLEDVAPRIDAFLHNIPRQYKKANSSHLKMQHRRTFPFFPRASCGGENATALMTTVCGLNRLAQGCVVYSIRNSTDQPITWDMEATLLQATPCDIHTFGGSGEGLPLSRKRLHHASTWSTEPLLHHNRLDIMILDVDGDEWDLLHTWPELAVNSHQVQLPMQLIVKIYYRNGKTPVDGMSLGIHLMRMGYVVQVRNDAASGDSSYSQSVTLTRVRC